MKPVQESHVGSGSFTGKVVKSRLNNARMGMILDMLAKKYNQPHTAALREYVSNAWDSHRSAGVTRPVEVTLPTEFSPQLIIQDFGVGMSGEEIVDVYSGFGFSTKDENNDDIGGFGIGSKSALAISNQFSVVSVKDGLKNMLVAAREDGDILYKFAIEDAPTDEVNGVTVTIPMKNTSAYETGKAKSVLNMWKVSEVKVVNNDNANDRIADTWIETENGYLNPVLFESFKINPAFSPLTISVGPVSYPAPRVYISDHKVSQIVSYSVPKMGIHEVEVAQSREILVENKENTDIIISRYNSLYHDAQELFNKRKASCKTMREAVDLRFSLYAIRRVDALSDFTFQGEIVPSLATVSEDVLTVTITKDDRIKSRSKSKLLISDAGNFTLDSEFDFVIVLDKDVSMPSIRSAIHEIIYAQNQDMLSGNKTKSEDLLFSGNNFMRQAEALIVPNKESLDPLILVQKTFNVSDILEKARVLRAENRKKNADAKGSVTRSKRTMGDRVVSQVTWMSNSGFRFHKTTLEEVKGMKNVVFYHQGHDHDFKNVERFGRSSNLSYKERYRIQLLSNYVLSIPEEDRPVFVGIPEHIKSIEPYVEFVEDAIVLPENWLKDGVVKLVESADKEHDGAVKRVIASKSAVKVVDEIGIDIFEKVDKPVQDFITKIKNVASLANNSAFNEMVGIEQNENHFALYSAFGSPFLSMFRKTEAEKKAVAKYISDELTIVMNGIEK